MSQQNGPVEDEYRRELEAQGRDLTQLRTDRGNPPLRAIENRARTLFVQEKAALPIATQSAAFAGRYVGLDKLMWLVRTLMSWDVYGDPCQAPGRRDPVLDPWRTRWKTITALRATLSASGNPAPGVGDERSRPEDSRSGGEVAPVLRNPRFDPALTIVHPGPVYKVVFSLDGRRAATACGDGAVRVWDARTWALLGTFTDDRLQRARTVALSPDGVLVAAGGEDLVERSPVFVWDITTGRLVNTPGPHHQREVLCLAFSSAGDSLVSAGRFGEVTTWSTDTWEPTPHPFVEGLLDNVLPFSGGRHLALHSRNDDKILLYDLGTRQLTQVFVPRFDREAGSMTVLDGLRLAVAVPEGIRIWNPSTRVCDRQLPRLDDVVSIMSFCPDLQLLACGTLERNLVIVDMATGRRVGEPLELHTKQINSVAFSPDGRLLASASSDHTLRVATGR